MHILIVPSWFPTFYSPNSGIFIVEQANSLSQQVPKLGILYGDFNLNNYLSKSLQPVDHQRENIDLNVTIHESIPFPKSFPILFTAWKNLYLKLFKKYVAKFGEPDVIHAHGFIGGFAAQHISNKYKIPYIITEHYSGLVTGNIKFFYKLKLSDLYKNASNLICPSSFLANSLKKYTQSAITIIPLGIDTHFFKRILPKDTTSSFNFITVGGVRKEKNYDLLVDAFLLLPDEIRDRSKITVVGSGPDQKRFLARIHKLGLTDSILFVGEKTRKEVKELLATSDCFLCSSSVETFGVSILEALSMGVPVISTKCGAPEEYLSKEVGVVVENYSSEKFAEAMEHLLKRYNEFDQNRIRNKVVSEFDNLVVIPKLLEVYNKVLSQNN